MPYTYTFVPSVGWPMSDPKVTIHTWDKRTVSDAQYRLTDKGIEITVSVPNRYHIKVGKGPVSEEALIDIPGAQNSTSLEERVRHLVENTPSLTPGATEGYFNLTKNTTPYSPIGADPTTGALPPGVLGDLSTRYAGASEVVKTVNGAAPDVNGNATVDTTPPDTGWRKVNFSTGSWSGNPYIRRVGNTVQVYIYHLSTTTAGSLSMVTLPIGFRPTPAGGAVDYYGPFSDIAGTSVRFVKIITGEVRSEDFAASVVYHVRFLFHTDEAFPTVLPGTAA